MEVDGMSGMPRMTISAPREVLREFASLCHRRGKSASEVLRDFMQEFVDSRIAEIEARDLAAPELLVCSESVSEMREGLARFELAFGEAAAFSLNKSTIVSETHGLERRVDASVRQSL
jgi:metal-responsive CopG/Arc/MetJ family transcriptional regulator